ncbi:hypothetical protein ACFLXJ_02560 [Chloroflexota bacterium]
MAIERNNRTHQFNPNGENSNGSFQEHDRQMRGFRTPHADIALVNGSRLDKAALIQRMEPLQGFRTMMETGGSVLPEITTDWSALVPVQRVARYKLSQN